MMIKATLKRLNRVCFYLSKSVLLEAVVLHIHWVITAFMLGLPYLLFWV